MWIDFFNILAQTVCLLFFVIGIVCVLKSFFKSLFKDAVKKHYKKIDEMDEYRDFKRDLKEELIFGIVCFVISICLFFTSVNFNNFLTFENISSRNIPYINYAKTEGNLIRGCVTVEEQFIGNAYIHLREDDGKEVIKSYMNYKKGHFKFGNSFTNEKFIKVKNVDIYLSEDDFKELKNANKISLKDVDYN